MNLELPIELRNIKIYPGDPLISGLIDMKKKENCNVKLMRMVDLVSQRKTKIFY